VKQSRHFLHAAWEQLKSEHKLRHDRD